MSERDCLGSPRAELKHPLGIRMALDGLVQMTMNHASKFHPRMSLILKVGQLKIYLLRSHQLERVPLELNLAQHLAHRPVFYQQEFPSRHQLHQNHHGTQWCLQQLG